MNSKKVEQELVTEPNWGYNRKARREQGLTRLNFSRRHLRLKEPGDTRLGRIAAMSSIDEAKRQEKAQQERNEL